MITLSNLYAYTDKNGDIVLRRDDYYDNVARLFLADAWRTNAGHAPIELLTQRSENYEELKQSEWSQTFEVQLRDHYLHGKVYMIEESSIVHFFTLMKNRLIMGRFRYGKLNDPSKAKWDRMGRIRKEVELYDVDGNDERLIDIANMCLLEFEEGTEDKEELLKITSASIRTFFHGDHKNKHFKSSDDSLHNEVIK
jgi:hypothetical protein